MRRKVVYHGGPTNSGKTYHALQRLKAADPLHGGGVYLGPLRLLALEVYDRLNEEGALALALALSVAVTVCVCMCSSLAL